MAREHEQVYLTDLVDRMMTPTPQVAGWKQQQPVGVTPSCCFVYCKRLSLLYSESVDLYPEPLPHI